MAIPTKLSRREREILEIVFALGEATLTEILERIEEAPTRAALRSILTILEEKGHLQHGKSGREFVYRPTVEKRGAGKSALRRVLDVFFGGSLQEAVSAHLSDPAEKLSAAEVTALEEIISRARKTPGRSSSKS